MQSEAPLIPYIKGLRKNSNHFFAVLFIYIYAGNDNQCFPSAAAELILLRSEISWLLFTISMGRPYHFPVSLRSK